MSASEYQTETAKSSVAVSMNAKGEAIVTVKVYDGVDPVVLEEIRQLAVGAYNATVREVRGPGSAS